MTTFETRLARLAALVSAPCSFADPVTPLDKKLNAMARAMREGGIPELTSDMSIAETIAVYMAQNEVTL